MAGPVTPERASDTDQGVPDQNHAEPLAIALQRKSDADRQRGAAALNQRAPQPAIDPLTRQPVYTTAPTQVPQFESPLALTGTPYVVGGKRIVSSGPGSARRTVSTDNSSTPRRHAGLDFKAPVGEKVLACDAGRCEVLVQVRGGAIWELFGKRVHSPLVIDGKRIKKPHADPSNGNLLAEVDGKEQIVLPRLFIGHGGLYVRIRHQSPHQNYETEYMHLSSVEVTHGAKVTVGTVLGYVGLTGGDDGIIATGAHLHWQVRFMGTVVSHPQSLVPNHWPGHPPEGEGPARFYVTSQGPLPVGQHAVNSQGAAQVTAADRSVTMAHQSVAHLREAGARHNEGGARRALTATAAVYEAVAKYQGRLPVVDDNQMTYNFGSGLWSNGLDKDGKPIDGTPL